MNRIKLFEDKLIIYYDDKKIETYRPGFINSKQILKYCGKIWSLTKTEIIKE